MRTFIFQYSSPNNIGGIGTIIVRANKLPEAQDKFYEWLREQHFYPHMWELDLHIKEADYFLGKNYEDNFQPGEF